MPCGLVPVISRSPSRFTINSRNSSGWPRTSLLVPLTLLKLSPPHLPTMVPLMLQNLAWADFGLLLSPTSPLPSPLIHQIASNNLAFGDPPFLPLSKMTSSRSSIQLVPSPTVTLNFPEPLLVMISWPQPSQLHIYLHAAFMTTPLLSRGIKKEAPILLDPLPTYSNYHPSISITSATSLSSTIFLATPT